MWNKDSFDVRAHYKGTRWSILVGSLLQENWLGAIGLVYGSCHEVERRVIFLELNSVIENLECPCVMLGDSNEILHIGDRPNQRNHFHGRF